MSGNMKSELSKSNKYWISKHRYLELRQFCMQYNEWNDALETLNVYPTRCYLYYTRGLNELSDPTEELASLKMDLMQKMSLVVHCCFDADPTIWNAIFLAVTKGRSFDCLKAKYDIPCGRDMFYDRYRKFFWLLDKVR